MGPTPKHIAFIMDGNRRWYLQQNSPKDTNVGIGHINGYHALERVLKWCLLLGVECVTVYAFSIENFRRSTDEVSFLMSLAEEKCAQLAFETKWLEENSVSIKVIGNRSLLPSGVQQKFSDAIKHTIQRNKVLNVAFAYTSTDEIERAILQKAKELNQNSKVVKLEKFLDTRESPPLDLMVRTSGEHRLSDFLLWQVRLHNYFVLGYNE